MKAPELPPNAVWCPICYGWQEIPPDGIAADHYIDHHRAWWLAQQPNGDKKTRRLVRR